MSRPKSRGWDVVNRARPAALRPSRVRHHAVGTGFVTTFDNRQVGPERIVASRDFGLKRLVRVGIESGHPPIPCFELREERGQFAVARRAAHQAHPRRALKDFFTFLLCDAPQHSNHFSVVRVFPEFPQPRKNFLCRLLPDAACVVKHHLRRFDVRNLLVPSPEQNSRDFLGVVNIHLAAKRLDIESGSASRGYTLIFRTPTRLCPGSIQIIEADIKGWRHSLCFKSYHTQFPRTGSAAKSFPISTFQIQIQRSLRPTPRNIPSRLFPSVLSVNSVLKSFPLTRQNRFPAPNLKPKSSLYIVIRYFGIDSTFKHPLVCNCLTAYGSCASLRWEHRSVF